MFGESMFRWVPEDAVTIALRWTRGRVVHETPGHLRTLDRQISALGDYASPIDAAMLDLINAATATGDLDKGIALLGLTPQQFTTERLIALSARHDPKHPEIRRALRGIPFANPFNRLWELQQMRAMYIAAQNLLEDAFCDLVVELAPTQGWDYLAGLQQRMAFPGLLRGRVDQQREERGEPGDPRRRPEQRYRPRLHIS